LGLSEIACLESETPISVGEMGNLAESPKARSLPNKSGRPSSRDDFAIDREMLMESEQTLWRLNPQQKKPPPPPPNVAPNLCLQQQMQAKIQNLTGPNKRKKRFSHLIC
jgi:hypothetical protein